MFQMLRIIDDDRDVSHIVIREKNATYLKNLSFKYEDALTNAGDSEV